MFRSNDTALIQSASTVRCDAFPAGCIIVFCQRRRRQRGRKTCGRNGGYRLRNKCANELDFVHWHDIWCSRKFYAASAMLTECTSWPSLVGHKLSHDGRWSCQLRPAGITFWSAVYVANFAQSRDPSDSTQGRFPFYCAGEVNIVLPGVVWLLFCSGPRKAGYILRRRKRLGYCEQDTHLQLLNCLALLCGQCKRWKRKRLNLKRLTNAKSIPSGGASPVKEPGHF